MGCVHVTRYEGPSSGLFEVVRGPMLVVTLWSAAYEIKLLVDAGEDINDGRQTNTLDLANNA